MIHNSSSDPVLIKKISLKIWSLRDEIEARIQDEMEAGDVSPEVLADKVNNLQAEYTKKSSGSGNNVLQLKSADDLAASGDGDDMEKAMAEAMAVEMKLLKLSKKRLPLKKLLLIILFQ